MLLTTRFLLPKTFQVSELDRSTSTNSVQITSRLMLDLNLTLVSNGDGIGMHFRVEFNVFAKTFVYDVNIIMSETQLAHNSSYRGSSTRGDNVGMEGNLSRQAEPQAPIQPQEPFQPPNSEQHSEPAQAPPNPPDVQVVQREYLLSMKEMFDQLVSNLKQDQPVVQAVAALSRAPIEKLSKHRAYTFAGTIEEKPEEAEYYLERTTQIVTKQLACSDEHKLECAIALLAGGALCWWETMTLTAPQKRLRGRSSSKSSRRNILVSNTSMIEGTDSCISSKPTS
ncbi:hypothetical protein GQ457_04G018870 [Hibiscus cannabinus]